MFKVFIKKILYKNNILIFLNEFCNKIRRNKVSGFFICVIIFLFDKCRLNLILRKDLFFIYLFVFFLEIFIFEVLLI